MESRKAEQNVELGRFKEELESLKSEHQKMEAEIKKQKLVFSNYQEKLQKCSSQTKEVNKKSEKSRKQRENAEKKEIDVRNALLELKTVYQVMIKNAPDFFLFVSSTLLLKLIFSGLKQMLILLVKVLKK